MAVDVLSNMDVWLALREARDELSEEARSSLRLATEGAQTLTGFPNRARAAEVRVVQLAIAGRHDGGFDVLQETARRSGVLVSLFHRLQQPSMVGHGQVS